MTETRQGTEPALVAGGPIAAAGTWQQVIRAAGGWCTCTGECGRSHARTEGRCPAETPRVRLYAAPTDPAVRVERAHLVDVADLSAWCGPCLDGARRTHTPPPGPAGVVGDMFALFDVEVTP